MALLGLAVAGDNPVAEDFIGCLNDLGADHKFLLGDIPTVADIACCGYLFWPEQAGLDLARWPHVQRWLGDIRALPGWQQPEDQRHA